MNKQTIYISIPMLGCDMIAHRLKAKVWQRCFELRGYTVINPFELAYQLRKSFIDIAGREPSEADYLHEDLMNLESCTELFLCDGWTESYGCMKEVDKGIELGLKFWYERKLNARYE